MLFNSYAFIFLFLPLVLLGYFQLARIKHIYAAAWLALASLFFYGYWNPAYVGLLLGSIVCNYAFGMWIAKADTRYKAQDTRSEGQGTTDLASNVSSQKQLLIFAVAANLLLLGYYKYANFFIGSINSVAGTQWSLGIIILPLGNQYQTI